MIKSLVGRSSSGFVRSQKSTIARKGYQYQVTQLKRTLFSLQKYNVQPKNLSHFKKCEPFHSSLLNSKFYSTLEKAEEPAVFKVVLDNSYLKTLDNAELIATVTEPLLEFIKKKTWEEAKPMLTKEQQYVYAFFQADELIAFEGWLPFFYKGGGECFDEIIAGLDAIKDITMKNLFIRATREIEEPNAWKTFSELKDKIDVHSGEPEELLRNEKFLSIFDPFRYIYDDYRKSTISKYAEFIRQNIDKFVQIQPKENEQESH
eukprot:TRINITY_DN25310_c0_g1_i1.p1 TRINITY_DN25310_c0_g1~~TRINITY_DN25310_c0_g1_i1.p1  ORF type:complete len:261 (+),score=54.30 TRINITY_DN25310_c0_g1_i1:77-859(+)